MTRPITLVVCLLCLNAPLHGADATGRPGAARPSRNVVLLIADDLSPDLGCYGNKVVRTPNLDALAAGSVRFSHAFTTVASCSPSRAALFTGQFIHANGQYGLAHAEHNQHTLGRVKSLPALLNAAGYRTGIVGKVHVQPRDAYPFSEHLKADPRDLAAVARAAGEFFTADPARPFCLVVGYVHPHRMGKGFGNDVTLPGLPDRADATYDPKDVTLPYFLPDQPEVRDDVADYYRAVSRLDAGVGLLLEALRTSGRADDTLVIFLSDNGMPFPGAKTTLYDPGIRLPLIVRPPGGERRGLVNDAMVSWVDILPTILDWTGVEPPVGPGALHGRSLLPILADEHPNGWDHVYGSHVFHEITMYYPVRMVRTRRHKYLLNLAHGLEFPFASDLYHSPTWQGVLRHGDGAMGRRRVKDFVNRPREELYDLDNDPEELHNLAQDPRHADTLDVLRAKMKDWQERTGDPWVVKYTHE
jgi:N-sulfoglucosamine sulfohydrolase